MHQPSLPLPTTMLVALAFLPVLSVPALSTAQGKVTLQDQQPQCQTFTETGKTVCGKFITYWQVHGGLSRQGYPISNEFNEISEVDGKSHRVQYFERAVFEYHPENRPPYDVLLSLLGNIQYKQRYFDDPPGQQPNNSAGSLLFSKTGKRLGGPFLEYWKANGGLMQQGYPISEEFQERSDLDGKVYWVQYFERAELELHPANRPPYDVLLSQLGVMQFMRKYGHPLPTPTPDAYAGLRQRPLKLPVLQSGSPCPITSGRTVSSDFGPALGSGPIYAVGFGPDGIAHYGGARQDGGWFLQKILWVGEPTYKGPILVRGGQIDKPGELRFGNGANPPIELLLHTDQGGETPSGWNNWPTYTRFRGPGCYAYQVDGSTFTTVIVFKAVDDLETIMGLAL